MRLLVTGGCGFIGSNFIRSWLARHRRDEIVNVDLLTYAGDRTILADIEASAHERYTFVHGDIADAALLGPLMAVRRPDMVVNFAAESHNSRAVIDPLAFTRTNVVGTHTLLEAARRAEVGRFHQISTCEVFGDLPLDGHEAFSETSPYRPRTPYNASKAAADLMVRAYHETFGLPVTISISCNTYGPWQHPEKVIPLFATNAIEGVPLPLYRSSEHRREWLHVADHCIALERILLDGRIGATYNIGTGEERSVEEVADAVLAALGRDASLKRYVPDRPGHDRRYLLDHGKIQRELGWRPTIQFEDGLAATVSWYAEHRPWWARKKLTDAASAIDEFGWRPSSRPG